MDRADLDFDESVRALAPDSVSSRELEDTSEDEMLSPDSSRRARRSWAERPGDPVQPIKGPDRRNSGHDKMLPSMPSVAEDDSPSRLETRRRSSSFNGQLPGTESMFLRAGDCADEEDEDGSPSLRHKNTFLNFDLAVASEMDEAFESIYSGSSSAPANMMEQWFQTKQSKQELLHLRGECTPCAYHLRKTDGCRRGDECSFCHLCTRGEIKRRKKERVKSLRAEAELSRRVKDPAAYTSL